MVEERALKALQSGFESQEEYKEKRQAVLKVITLDLQVASPCSLIPKAEETASKTVQCQFKSDSEYNGPSVDIGHGICYDRHVMNRQQTWRASKRKDCPGGCGTVVAHDTILCRDCHSRRKRDLALDRTIAQVKEENKSLRYSDHIRYFAREIYVGDACFICGYSLHIEVAHIKPVSSFPDSASLREVNDPSNLVGLCPNHHWELDNGIISL